VQDAFGKLCLALMQDDDLGNAQGMLVGQQDQCVIPLVMTAGLPNGLHVVLDFLPSQVSAAAPPPIYHPSKSSNIQEPA
jgi:hypothetical protein